MATREEVDRTLNTYERGPDDPDLADLMRGYLEASGAGVEPACRWPASRCRPMLSRNPYGAGAIGDGWTR